MLESRVGADIVELRSLIETGYCQLAALKATEEDWIHIKEAQEAYATYASLDERDLDVHTQLDLNFHFAIIEATHNPLVMMVSQTVEKIFFASIKKSLSKAPGWEWGISAHQQILESIDTGDPNQIRNTVLKSLTYWAKEIDEFPNIKS